jgi:hypothetical protein
VAVSKPHHPPLLFHKGELTEGPGADLSVRVRDAIGSADRRVVGVVLNAVDDHLLKADQVRPRWTVDCFQVLDALLHGARAGVRVVVLTSDHGHVLDAETRLERYDQGDRWRVDDGRPAPDEIVLAGPRVGVAPGTRVIAPWSERTRYGIRKNGYHGGATPQEAVVPLAILAPLDARVEGWAEIPMTYPAWWDVAPPAHREAPRLSPRPATMPPPEPRGTLAFQFEPRVAASTPADAWIARLLESPVFAAQTRLAGRLALPDDRVRAVLAALEERGGKLTRVALAHRLGQPPVRVGGILAALRRLLNVEGYPVLTVDEASDTVELNRELLFVQFGLGT